MGESASEIGIESMPDAGSEVTKKFEENSLLDLSVEFIGQIDYIYDLPLEK